jgi:hypothetical protein
LALPPVTDYRTTPPVDSIGDRRLERARRDFLDLIRSDDEKHEGGSQRRNRERQANEQETQAQDAQRQTRIATDRTRDRMRMVNVPANANQAQQPRPAAEPRQDNASRNVPAGASGTAPRNPPQASANQAPAPALSNPKRPAGAEASDLPRVSTITRSIADAPITPVLRRDPQARDNPSQTALRPQQAIAGKQPTSQQAQIKESSAQLAPDAVRPRQQDGLARSEIRQERREDNVTGAFTAPARSRWPEPPAGSSLVAASPAAAALNLVAASTLQQAASVFRLSREVPREVADRISQFLLTGFLNRAPFSFPQVATGEV